MELMAQPDHLDQVLPGLYASPAHPLPFAPRLEVRAFVLARDAGNLLIYSVPTLPGTSPALAELGGVIRQYLNHWHEAPYGGAAEVHAAGIPLFCHEADRAVVEQTCPVDGTFSQRTTLDGDFEAIPTPGHTPGATAYLWDTGEHRLLFTGDSLFLHEGEWVAAVLPSSDRAAYVESLELLRDLDFDVLVPWAATAGRPFVAHTDGADARRRIAAVLERVRRGADS